MARRPNLFESSAFLISLRAAEALISPKMQECSAKSLRGASAWCGSLQAVGMQTAPLGFL